MTIKTPMKLIAASLASLFIAFALQAASSSKVAPLPENLIQENSLQKNPVEENSLTEVTSDPTFWSSNAHKKAYVGGEGGVMDWDVQPGYQDLAQAWAR